MDKLRMTCFKDHLRTTFYQSQSIVLLFIFHSDKYKNTLTTSFTKFVRCNSLTKEMVNDRNTDIKNGLVGFYSGCPREIFKYWTPNSNPLIRSNWENFFAGSWVELVVLNGALLLLETLIAAANGSAAFDRARLVRRQQPRMTWGVGKMTTGYIWCTVRLSQSAQIVGWRWKMVVFFSVIIGGVVELKRPLRWSLTNGLLVFTLIVGAILRLSWFV